MPFLCVFSCTVSVLCGALVGYFELNLDMLYFMYKVFDTPTLHDFFSGYIKTYFFSAFITLTACYFGMQVSQGTYEVGSATTKAVVYSSVLIVLGDYVLTKLYWMMV